MDTAIVILGGALVLGGTFFAVQQARRKQRGNPIPDAPGPQIELTDVPVSKVTAGMDAVIVGDVDSPLLTIVPLEPRNIVALPQNDGRPAIPASLERFISQSPELLRLSREVAWPALRVTFTPETMLKLKDGSLVLVQDKFGEFLPVARDVANGKFVRIARVLQPSNALRLANVAALSFQVASFLTAQQYLGEINERLKGIEDTLKEVQRFQFAELRGRIRANVDYLIESKDRISRGLSVEKTAEILQELHSVERECATAANTAESMLDDAIEAVHKLSISPIMDRKGSAQGGEKAVAECRARLEMFLLAQNCRLLVCDVLALASNDVEWIERRIGSVEKRVNFAWEKFQSILPIFGSRVVDPLGPRSGPFVYVDKDYRPELKTALGGTMDACGEMVGKLRNHATRTREIASQQNLLGAAGLVLDLSMKTEGVFEITAVRASTSPEPVTASL